VAEADRTAFFSLVRAGFSAARKQLVNSLAQGLKLEKEQALSVLAMAGIDPRRRAETVAIDEWLGLLKAYREAGPT